MATIQAVRSDAPRPAQRARPRVAPLQPVAIVSEAPATVLSNVSALEGELNGHLQAYATANAKKNEGTKEEKKAKDTLNKLMLANGLLAHSFKCDLDGSSIQFDAKIESAEEEEIDPVALLKFLGNDLEAFLALVSVPKGKVEAALGKNAAIATVRTVKKPEALSIKRAK